MKINVDNLAAHLQHILSPLYLLCGDDILQRNEAVAMLRHYANEQGFSEKEKCNIHNVADWHNLAICAESQSLFSDKTFIECHVHMKSPGHAGAKTLVEYASHPPVDKILCLIMGKLDKASKKTKWFQALDKSGAIIQIWPIEKSALPAWLKTRAARLDLQLSNDAANLLADHVEGNLLAAHQELEKCFLLYGAGELRTEQIRETITDHNHYDLFQWIDAILIGEPVRMLKILDSLKHSNNEPVLLLWALVRELRVLCALSFAQLNQLRLDKIFKTHHIWSTRQALLTAASRRHSLNNWHTLLSHARALDELIKGERRGDVWHALKDLSLKIAGIKLV